MGTRLRSSTRASTVASESLAETNAEMKLSKGDTKRTTSVTQKPMKKSELVRLRRLALMALFTSIVFMGGVFYLAFMDIIKFYPNSIKMESLRGFNSRGEFALRYQTLLYGWLVFNVYSVMFVRVTKTALNPLVESTEKHTHSIKNILANSFEQIVISSFLQFGFVSFADPALTMKLIPVINMTQLLGRIFFFLGYPLYRTFGFSLTMMPNTALFCYNFFKFGAYLGLY